MSRYLLAFVYRPAHGADASNSGVSSKHDMLFIPCAGGNYSFDELEPERILDVTKNKAGDGFNFHPHGRPKGMSGGNFLYSLDSRFRQQYGENPIRIFDRYE